MTPLSARFETTLRALLEDVLDPDGAGLDHARLDLAAAQLAGLFEDMPPHVGAGLRALVLVLGAGGRGAYAGLPRARRIARLRRYQRLPGWKDLVSFVEKMGGFVWFSLVEEEEDASAHPGAGGAA